MYRELDTDKSGKLGKDEMHEAMDMLGIVLSAEEFEKMWSDMDSDGGGQVGFREFKDAMKQFRNTKH